MTNIRKDKTCVIYDLNVKWDPGKHITVNAKDKRVQQQLINS